MLEHFFIWLATDTSGIIFSLFLCLALGHIFGTIKFGFITLGTTVGSLFVAVTLSIVASSYAHYEMPSIFSNIFFFLFIFALGYDVGPGFVQSLKASGVKLIIMAFFFCTIMLGLGIACYYFFNLDNGELVGLFAGASTQSSVLGSATAMMQALNLPAEEINTMTTKMTVAYAFGYLISYAGCVIIIKTLLPYLAGCRNIDGVRNEIKKAVAAGTHVLEQDEGSIFNNLKLRTYSISPDSKLIGMSIQDFQKEFANKLIIETVIKELTNDNVECIAFDNQYVLQAGDVVAILGELKYINKLLELGAIEVTDDKYQKAFITKSTLVITRNLDISEVETLFGNHIMPVKAARNGKTFTDFSSFKHGDVVEFMGTKAALSYLTKEIGYPVDAGEDSDIVYLCGGILAGIILGLISININGVAVGLGTSAGLIVLGIICGWYNDKNPNKCYINPGARWLMKNIGLNFFVICLGLTSGAAFIPALKEMGAPMITSVFIMAFIPHVITILFARFVLKLNPIDLLGGCTGCGTNIAALNGLVEDTGSSIFANAFTPTYAIANILLTMLGPISVGFFH